jgi:hypothetical protein
MGSAIWKQKMASCNFNSLSGDCERKSRRLGCGVVCCVVLSRALQQCIGLSDENFHLLSVENKGNVHEVCTTRLQNEIWKRELATRSEKAVSFYPDVRMKVMGACLIQSNYGLVSSPNNFISPRRLLIAFSVGVGGTFLANAAPTSVHRPPNRRTHATPFLP